MFSKKTVTDQDILDHLYDFVLDASITDRERRIGLLAKADLEKGSYDVRIVNKVMASLQLEAMKNGLTPVAKHLYYYLDAVMNHITPIGTNRGSMQFQDGYLD